MVELVLERACGQARGLYAERLSEPVPSVDADPHLAPDPPAKIRHAQAAFEHRRLLVGEKRQARVDEDRQREVRLVGVPRIVVHMDRGESNALADLGRGQTSPLRGVHGVDEVVDQRLKLAAAYEVKIDRLRDTAKHRIAELPEVTRRHVGRSAPSRRRP